MTVAKVKHKRETAGRTWTDCKTNTETANGLNINPGFGQIQDCRKKLD